MYSVVNLETRQLELIEEPVILSPLPQVEVVHDLAVIPQLNILAA